MRNDKDTILLSAMIITLILGVTLISGCSNSTPGMLQPLIPKYTLTNVSYDYSVDCAHNVVCYFYFGNAATPSCVSVLPSTLNNDCPGWMK